MARHLVLLSNNRASRHDKIVNGFRVINSRISPVVLVSFPTSAFRSLAVLSPALIALIWVTSLRPSKMPDQNTKFVNSLYLKNLIENYFQENEVKVKAYTVEPASLTETGRSSMNRVLVKYEIFFWSCDVGLKLLQTAVYNWTTPLD